MTAIHDLDRWAEDTFARMCAEAGATRNPSVQDRTGWDYVVEFSSETHPDVPPDLRAPPQTTWVQVKSKVQGRPETRLRLSNALRFATDPSPCFVVLFQATDGGHPVRVFAKHIWTKQIEDILRRVRQAHAQGRDDLHKLSVVIPFRAEDEHTDDLIPWMIATIGAIPGDYTEQKRRIVRSVGLEDGGIFGSITYRLEDLPQLVDHQLGLAEGAPMEHVTIRHRRFGIEARQPLVSAKPHFSQIRVLPISCRVRLRQAGAKEIWLDGELRVPNLPDLPPELFKTRITADFLDCVWAEGLGTAKVSYRREAPRTLAANRALLDALAMFDNGPVDMTVYYDGAVLNLAELSIGTGEEPLAHPSLSARLRCLELVAGQVAPQDLAISLIDLNKAGVEILRLSDLTTSTEWVVALTTEGPVGDLDGCTDVIAYTTADVGDWTFMAIVGRSITHIESAKDKLTIALGAPRLIEGMVRRGSADQHRANLVALYRASVEAIGGGAIELFGGDFAAMQAGLTSPALDQ
jgi:hypothetical protein